MIGLNAAFPILGLTRGLQPTDERMRLREAMTAQAMNYSWPVLWLLELMLLVFSAMCMFALWINPAEWIIFGGGIAMFLPLAGLIAWMMTLRHQSGAAYQK